MGVPRKMTLPQRHEVVAYRRAHPAMTCEEIGDRFGITGTYVSVLCQRDLDRRIPNLPPPKPKAVANAMPWATNSLLTGGNARRAKLPQPA
jgi:hypothetical protein